MKRDKLVALIICMMLLVSTAAGCGSAVDPAGDGTQTRSASESQDAADIEYTYEEFPLKRKGIRLHLDKIEEEGAADPEKNILLVLYAPIITGIGEAEVTGPFHHNTWEHAADDFQKRPDGTIDYDIVEPEVVEIFCSSCWRYDADQSPNGGRRDVCVGDSHILIDLGRIKTPTLVICGDKDPYLNYDHVDRCLDKLPEGSAYEKIPGASHVAYIEAPYYHDFQDRLMNYLAA